MQDLRTERKGQILAVKDLPTLPTVLEKVSKMIDDDRSSPEQIAKVISQDQVLSAKVLKMVNSPIYGFPRRITTVQHALVLLGLNVIRGLIISTSVFDVMTQNMVGLWEHSVACAMAASEVAKAAGFKDPEEYSITGLLHDLGKVVVAVQLPSSKSEIEDLVKKQDLTYLAAEKEILGFGHDRVNAWLADHWHLPLNIKEGMAYHHRPQRAQHHPKSAHVVHLADFLIKVLEVGSGGDDQVPILDKRSLQDLGLSLDDLQHLLDTLTASLIDLQDLSPN